MSASRLSLVLLATAALGACATVAPMAPAPSRASIAKTPTELWTPEVAPQPERIMLAVHAQGLSSTQADALAAFADDWRAGGRGPVTLQAPVGGPDPAMVSRSTEGVRALLASYGAQVHVSGYEAKGDPRAPLIVGRERYAVSLPTCGLEWGNISRSATNEVQSNFGCAVSANIAAQIANPGDLLGPAEITAIDAQRRGVVLDKYRKGEVTAAARDDQAKGTVSQVVK
ncbi:CpaD family pilus assembly lipoprotein [Phenylobacterium sp.]|uniref:CpaD family pilus assembly protein n=1 Tax=Phenylobacterium sp. TaxID=1871053 RepID=UPI0028A15734|nr:CpaD family pilus assembly lipoprotein [Phenylobacterium sp.]